MKRAGLVAAIAGSALLLAGGGHAAPGPTPHSAPPAAAASPPGRDAPRTSDKPSSADLNKEVAAPDEAADARNAARTRMRECGHQWSTMKKSGAAGSMTWKDFSQVCLARK